MVKTKLKIQQESKQMISSSSSSCEMKKYKGVRMRSWGSWVSEIRAPNQKTRIWLGSYATPEAAARAYDAALLCLKGSSASLNFPITSSSYIPDTIMSPKSIQRVAASAANSNNVDNGAATPPPISPPPSFTSSSSSSSVSSLPSDQVHDDDDVSLIQSLVAGAAAANSFLDNATTTSTPPLSPQPTSSSSTSSVSSPSISSSSPSDQVDHDDDDDDVSLIQSLVANDQPVSITEPWYSDILLSPNYIDQMFDLGSSDSSTMVDDFYEEGDILLWSFC